LAAAILASVRSSSGLEPVLYEDDVHPYSDLVLGRVDAVLLDQVLAERGTRRHAGLVSQPEAVAVGHYGGVLASHNAALRDEIDDVLRAAMKDGRLEAIFRKWRLWNDDQPLLYDRVLAGTFVPPTSLTIDAPPPPVSAWTLTAQYLPVLL